MAIQAGTRTITKSRRTERETRRLEAQERRTSTLRKPKSPLLTVLMGLTLIYSLLPLFWLFVNATKTQENLLTSFGLWFSGPFALFDNIVQTFTFQDGAFGRWLLNTLFYVVVGAGGATLIATIAGYGLAHFNFPGKRGFFAVVLGSIAIPGTALAVPTFLLFSALGMTNNPWSVIVPSLVNPFGLYLIWVFAKDAVPAELLEAARVDGAGEGRIFFSIALRLLMPGFITVLLFSVVGTWNNYFLPLIMLSDPTWYPLTVGLDHWNALAATNGAQPVYNLVITASLLTIVPIVIAFLFMQRYWQSGLTAGSVKQ